MIGAILVHFHDAFTVHQPPASYKDAFYVEENPWARRI
jgi:hypothetical protein